MRVICLTLLSFLICTKPVAADNWPRFRGPNGTGLAADKGIPVRWHSDHYLWKVPVPGQGNASPIVWGDHVFLHAASTDGSQRLLLCYRASTGQLQWSRSIEAVKTATHKKNSLASSTPATDGTRVYVLFWDGRKIVMHAYDFQGSPLWRHDLGPYVSQHGVGISPIVYDDKVYLANDQDGSATVLALDARTGELAWQAERRPFRACSSTPLVLERPDAEPELVVVSTAGITSYQPRSGAVNWEWTWTFANKPLRTVSSPVTAHGLVFATSGDGGGDRHTVAVRIGGRGHHPKPQLVWEKHKTLPYVPSLLANEEYLFYVNDAGLAGCLLAKSGDEVWSARLGNSVTASPVLIDGKVYAVGEDGVVSVFLAAPAFKLLAKNELGEAVIASPAVADGRLFIRGHEHLFCVGVGKD